MESEKRLDDAVHVMSTSVSKMCDYFSAPVQHEQQQQLKFKEFHAAMNDILVQLPYIEATRVTLDCMERANVALQSFSSNKMNE